MDMALILLNLFLFVVFLFSATFAVILLFTGCSKDSNKCLCFLGPFLAIAAVALALGLIIATLEVEVQVAETLLSSVPLLQSKL
ncbi:hypothetical protein WAK64_07780 [Bacillus spongiae]|uniref:Uncharacterized protein n=1 Tax=Bacillus spongiae TaxID=2683610 RepID=A0ABU8HCB7_9BACI